MSSQFSILVQCVFLLVLIPASVRAQPGNGPPQINFQAMGNSSTIYKGQGTFYGQQPGQDDQGTCSYGAAAANTLDLPWTSGIETTLALNDQQFQGGLACGLCVYFRGTGGGIGTTPVSSEWQYAFIDNLCPECSYGDIDINQNANGRWNVEWYPVACQVGNSSFRYTGVGEEGNPYFFQFSVSNTRVPVQQMEMNNNGAWYAMRRTSNNLYAANGGPFNSWPLGLRITSVLGDVVYDQLASALGGQGSAQFPDRSNSTLPALGGQFSGSSQSGSSTPSTPLPTPSSTPAQTSSPSPITPAANLSPSQGLYTVVNGGQCGGTSFYCGLLTALEACVDGVWPESSCNPGYSCQRSNATWWSCQASSTPAPPATTNANPATSITPGVQVLPSSSVPPVSGWPVPAEGQCGGNTSWCRFLSNDCTDAAWTGAQCPSGYTCSRVNAGWWQCKTPAEVALLTNSPPPGNNSQFSPPNGLTPPIPPLNNSPPTGPSQSTATQSSSSTPTGASNTTQSTSTQTASSSTRQYATSGSGGGSQAQSGSQSTAFLESSAASSVGRKLLLEL